jgi:thioredoxin reductase (NADPH)
VTLIHRRDELRASKILQQRAFANDKLQFLWNSEVVALMGQQTLTSIKVRDVPTGQTSHLAVTGLFLAIGHTPASGLVSDQLETNQQGYVLTEPGRTMTSVDGVFACGDVQDPIYRQAITSAGTGCMAALDAERWLQSQEDTETFDRVVAVAATT